MIRLAGFFIVSLLFAGCATKVVPLHATVSTVQVKLEHPKADKRYILLSTSREGVIDVKVPDTQGTITFDLSRAATVADRCFYVSDGKELVPINDTFFGFTNSVRSQHIVASDRLRTVNQEIAQEQRFIADSYSYRGGACVVLTPRDIPAQPVAACAPTDAVRFTEQACKSQYAKPQSTGESVVNSIISGVVGTVVGVVTGPVGGIAAGVATDLFLSNSDKQRQYAQCLNVTRQSCQSSYDSWSSVASKIRDNPQGLHQQCQRGLEKFSGLDREQLGLNRRIAELKIDPGIVTEAQYCRSQK